MKTSDPDAILRPGATHWELWRFPAKGPPVVEENPTTISGTKRLVLALPCRDVLALPLWIAAQADAGEVAELEFSSRHLLRRQTAVHAVPLGRDDKRALILALAPSDDSSAQPFFTKAGAFEASARLFDGTGTDVIVWRELGELCFSFWSDNRCFYFAATGETLPGPAFCGALQRTALRLKSEGILSRLPAHLRLIGDFSAEEAAALGAALRIEVQHVPALPPPRLPTSLSLIAPTEASVHFRQRATNRRVASIAAVIGIAYFLLVAVLMGDVLWKSHQFQNLMAEKNALAPQSDAARKDVTEWREFRDAVDPRTFAIDLLGAVAMEIPGDLLRLTQFSMENGRILITGEAADVSQAYAFLEKVKASPALQDYDWTPRQPQLAGKSKVRFEMEGVRPDAKTDTE